MLVLVSVTVVNIFVKRERALMKPDELVLHRQLKNDARHYRYDKEYDTYFQCVGGKDGEHEE